MKNVSLVNLSECVLTRLDALTEGFNDASKEFPIRIIKPGRSLNDTIYPPAALEEMRQFLTAADSHSRKMYIDHVFLKEGQPYTGRSVRDWAASIQEASIHTDGSLVGKGKVTAHNPWIYELIKDMPDELGVSIHISALVEKLDQWQDGKPGTVIRQVVRFFSPDFVTEASAGGGILVEGVSQKESASLLDEAFSLAHKSGNTQLCSLVESMRANRPIVVSMNIPEIKKVKSEEAWAWTWENEGQALIDKGGWAMLGRAHAYVDFDYEATEYEGRYPKVKEAYAFPFAKLVEGVLTIFLKGVESATEGMTSAPDTMSKPAMKRAKKKMSVMKQSFVDNKTEAKTTLEYWISSEGEPEDVLVPFKDKVSQAKKIDDAHQLFWALNDYLRILCWDKNGVPLEDRLVAAKDALEYTMSEIDDLLSEIPDEEEAQERLAFVSRPTAEACGLYLLEDLRGKALVRDQIKNHIQS